MAQINALPPFLVPASTKTSVFVRQMISWVIQASLRILGCLDPEPMIGEPSLALLGIEDLVETIDHLRFTAARVPVKGLPVGPIEINEGNQK